MTTRHAIFAATALLLACIGSSAMAGQYWHRGHGGDWHATHHAIYELENGVALLEADPETDDGYKAPVITRARADVSRLRATLPRAEWRSASPCCYSRAPIYIR